MKKYVSTIIFISIIVISVLMGVRQYKNDESLKSKENEEDPVKRALRGEDI